MTARIALAVLLMYMVVRSSLPAPACCPAPPSGKPVVNADQTVIILWDAANKMEHFIRKASFKSEADHFGFLIPSPSQPELDESGNDVFPYLQKLTEPQKVKRPRPSDGLGCGCSQKSANFPLAKAGVVVLEEKVVAGFKAAVLETTSAIALVGWLKDNGYAYSPEIEAWAKPYVENGWKITALKIAKDGKEQRSDTASTSRGDLRIGTDGAWRKEQKMDQKSVTASALRMSFKTERPLFPYREPDTRRAATALEATHRLLRIYFLADARFQGALTREDRWTGKVAWANKVSDADRKKALELLKLPETTGPADWWLTEFEDNWPYRVAPADLTFTRDDDQDPIRRPPIVEYVASPWPADAMTYALAAVVVLPLVIRRLRRERSGV